MPTYIVPNYSSKFLEEKSGLISRDWYLFLQSLYSSAGGGALGTPTQVLHGSGSGFSAVSLTADVSGKLPLSSFVRGTNGQIIVGVTGADAAYQSMSGDATLVSSGAITVTKTNGVAFAASATSDTTNATNITSGTLPTARFETIASWTPADNSGAGLSFSAVSASYTQIGNLVFAYFTLTYPVTVSGASASISGLPLTVANANYAQAPSIVATTAGISVVIVPTKNTLTAAFDISTSLAAVTNLQLSGSTVSAMIHYPIT